MVKRKQVCTPWATVKANKPALLDSAKSLSKRLSTHQKIIHVMKSEGWLQPWQIQNRMGVRFNGCRISESSLTRRLREMRVKGYPIEMKRASKSGAACVYRLVRIKGGHA